MADEATTGSSPARPKLFSKRTAWNSVPNALAEAIACAIAAGGKLLDLSESNPTRCGFEFDAATILSSFSQPEILSYAPDPRGLQSARAAVASYYSELGIEVALDDLILTTSTSEAYSFLFRLLCDPGDEVLVPTPSYP